MTKAPVSVIVPAYNAAPFLAQCLHSVLAQSCPPAEVIVVDDGSDDQTEDVARSFGEAVRFERQENLGPSAARNRGLALARLPYVAFLDADDYWKPEFLQMGIEFLQQHPQAIAVSTGLVVRDASGVEQPLTAALGTGKPGARAVMIKNFFETWAAHDHVRTGSAVFRTEVLQRAGGFREDLRAAEDLEFWGYLATLGPWGFIPNALWVGNPVVGTAANLLRKLERRGRSCPEVESWQERVIARVAPEDMPAFQRVRGRVAASFAYVRILAGCDEVARRIVSVHGARMPPSRVRLLLLAGDSAGSFGWWMTCGIIRARERFKAAGLLRLHGPDR